MRMCLCVFIAELYNISSLLVHYYDMLQIIYFFFSLCMCVFVCVFFLCMYVRVFICVCKRVVVHPLPSYRALLPPPQPPTPQVVEQVVVALVGLLRYHARDSCRCHCASWCGSLKDSWCSLPRTTRPSTATLTSSTSGTTRS